MNRDTTIAEQLQELYTQFPELKEIEEASAFGAAAKSLGQSALKGAGNLAAKAISKVPIVGSMAQGIQSGKQPQQAQQPQQKQGFFHGVGQAIGKAVAAGQQAKAASAPAPSTDEELDVEGMQATTQSGLEGFEVDLNTAYKAIKKFATQGLTPVQKTPPRTQAQNQPPSQAQAAQPSQSTPATTGQQEQEQESVIRSYGQLIQELVKLDPLYEEATQPDPALVQKMQNYAKNLVAKAKDFNALKNNDQMLKALVAFVTEAQKAGLTIPGLENVNPQNLQAAIDQEKQIAGNAEQQIQQMPDAQVQQLIASMDRRMLKKIILDNPEIAKQLVASMNKQAPQQ